MRCWKTCLMRKQHRDTFIKVVPDTATDSDGTHLPVRGRCKQKNQMKALDECESCLYETMWYMGEHVHQLSQQTRGFPNGKKIKAEERDCFSGYRVLVLGILQSFLNFHSHSGQPSLSIKWGSTTHNYVTHFFACPVVVWEWEKQLESIYRAQGEFQVNTSKESLHIKCVAR